MSRSATWRAALAVGTSLLFHVPAGADITSVARCQKKLATAGAQFAVKVIKSTLKCTNEIVECQVQCEQGVFGPVCTSNPPPDPPGCCDPDDVEPFENSAFAECMANADTVCAQQDVLMAKAEVNKQTKIISGCSTLAPEELCGAQTDGLNFATLNAGCQALDPNYTCSLNGLITCIGGPLERRLTDQISFLLNPRAGDAISALGLQASFPGIPVTRRLKEDIPDAGKVDVWRLTGLAGDEVIVTVKTRDDTGSTQSTLRPTVVLLGSDLSTPVPDTIQNTAGCGVPNVCGTSCPQFRRQLPFNGNFYALVGGQNVGGCDGGKYKLVVTSPAAITPVLVFDDVTPP